MQYRVIKRYASKKYELVILRKEGRMRMELILPKYLNGNSLEETLKEISDGKKFKTINLSKIEFIFPYGLNILMHIFESLNTVEEIILPNDKIMSYLSRMDFFNHLESNMELTEDTKYHIKLHSFGRNSDNKTLLELTRIEDLKDTLKVISKIEEKIQQILKIQLKYNDAEVQMFRTIFGELCQNISRHSLGHGYASTQYIPYYMTRKSEIYHNPLKLGITDLGIGFAKTYSDILTDEDALIRAVVNNETSKESGGLGLKHIKEYIKKFGERYILGQEQQHIISLVRVEITSLLKI